MSTATPVRDRRTATRAPVDALLVRSADGDRAAFAALYDETASRAFGIALRLLRDPGLAEDAVQEAYLAIWQKARSFDPRKGTSVGWMFQIVHHTAVDHVRSAQSRVARDDRYTRGESLGRQDGNDPTYCLASDSDDARIVRAALDDLPGPQRQALELAYFDGYTYREVAELLGIPLGTAKTRIRDGQIRLQASEGIRALQAARNGAVERE